MVCFCFCCLIIQHESGCHRFSLFLPDQSLNDLQEKRCYSKQSIHNKSWHHLRKHLHCQDFDVHDLLSELPTCCRVEFKGAFIGSQIPEETDTVILCLNTLTRRLTAYRFSYKRKQHYNQCVKENSLYLLLNVYSLTL